MSDFNTPLTPTGVPTGTLPYRLGPYNNITPFTTRDGETYIDELEKLKSWLANFLVPYVDTEIADYVDAFNVALTKVDEAFTEALAEIAAKGSEIDAKIAAFNATVTNATNAFNATVTAANTALDAKITTANTTIDGKVAAAGNSATAAAASAVTAQQWSAATQALQDLAVKNLLTDTTSLAYAALFASIDKRGGARFTPLQFGAVGDGVTDDTTAVRAAMNAAIAAPSGILWIEGRYATDSLTLPSNCTIDGGGTLVQRIDTESLLRTTSTNSEVVTADVTADVSPGDNAITITNYQNNLASGDLIVLYDAYSYDPTYAPNVSGEILEVLSATANKIVLKNAVMGAFTASKNYLVSNGTKLRKLVTTGNIRVSNIKLEGRRSSATELILFNYARDVVINNIRVTSSGDNQVRFNVSDTVKVVNSTFRNAVDNLAATPAQQGYAVHASNATCRFIVSNNHFKNIRHGFTTTGGSKGIPRTGVVSGNTVENLYTAEGGQGGGGLDTHSGGDNIVISNNVLVNCAIGITVRSRNTLVTGNHVRHCPTGIRVAETVADTVSIKGNHIVDTTYGIYVSDNCANMDISDNTIKLNSSIGIYVPGTVKDIVITRNTFKTLQATGLSIDSHCSGMLIAANDFYDVGLGGGGNGVNIGGDGTGSGRLDIVGNRFIQGGGTPARCVNASRATQVKGNTALGANLFTSSTLWQAAVGGVSANQSGNNEYA